MRRLTVAVLVVLAMTSLASCKKNKKDVQYVEEGGSQLSAAVNTADPRSAIQLLRGFHDVENNAWRWTGPKFAVALRPPKDVPAEGAKLFLDYAVPDLFIQKVPQTTLTIFVNGKALDPEVITKAGAATLIRTVPSELLKGDVVTIDFSLDKFLAQGAVDQRELGLIVSAVGLRGTPAPPAPPAPAK
jgi:hypothetical protein